MSRVKVKDQGTKKVDAALDDVDAALADIEANFDQLDKDLGVSDVEDMLGDLDALDDLVPDDEDDSVGDDLDDMLAELDNDLVPESPNEKPRKAKNTKGSKVKVKEAEELPLGDGVVSAGLNNFIDALSGATDEILARLCEVVNKHEMASTKRGSTIAKEFKAVNDTLAAIYTAAGDAREIALSNNQLLTELIANLKGAPSSKTTEKAATKKAAKFDIPEPMGSKLKSIFGTLTGKGTSPEKAAGIIEDKLKASATPYTTAQLLEFFQ